MKLKTLVLKIITRHSTSMISNDTQHNQNTRPRSITGYFYCVLLWRRLKFSLKFTIIKLKNC